MYEELSTVALIDIIVKDMDPRALDCFHTYRKLFRTPTVQEMRFIEFVDYLSESHRGGYCQEVLEAAFDLTVSKFSNLPDENMKTEGPDCRCYFRAFLDYAKSRLGDNKNDKSIKMELKTAKFLQNFVLRHFHLSCLECARRQNGLSRRYIWNFDSRRIPVWMPSSMSAPECKKWLETHIKADDLPKEQIQAQIDRNIQRGLLVSLENLVSDVPAADVDSQKGYGYIRDLARTVADEKAAHIESQRPAIKKLGPERLKRLILRIFDELSAGSFNAGQIAESFGLSGATFSRFASNHWHHAADSGASGVPDLWSNTAGVLASDSAFTEAARNAGIFDTIRTIAESQWR